MEKHLTSDGLLGGASQSNKGGESLQRSDYRRVYQMAMGLQAQLIAALSHGERIAFLGSPRQEKVSCQ
ncbi:MAG TPA: hypothetical protein EYP14_09870 [Planctomycetaceae bacterium]|nr:hypothetical protein [Planctomycetaceae bacterium]